MEETAIKIFISVSGTITVAVVLGVVKLRDTILSQAREIKWLQEDLSKLENAYEKDKVERNSLMTLATSIDTKIDAKLKDILSELADQRHQDSQVFSATMNEVKIALTEINMTLKHMRGEVEHIKKGHAKTP